MKRTLLGLGLAVLLAAPAVAAPIEFKPAPPAMPPPSAPAPPAKKPSPPPSSPAPPPAPADRPPPPPLAPAPGDTLLPPSPDAPAGPPPPLAPAPGDTLPVGSQAYPPPPSAAPPPAPAPATPAVPPGAPGYPPPGPYPAYPPVPYPGYPPGYPPGYYGGPYGYAPPPAVGVHTHDGFYLRLGLGFGPTSLTLVDGPTKLEVTGISSTISVSLGGALTPNLILFGELVVASDNEPTLKINGTGQGAQTRGYDLGGLGAGATYYFMPRNVFVSASVALVSLQFPNQLDMRVAKDSGNGGLGRLTVGKEWWLSDNWGMGVGGQLMLGGVKAQKSDSADVGLANGTWKFASLSVLVSATFN